jgi:hypothetical protein
VLSAIFVARGRSIAVINGTRLGVGDSIGEVQVLEILPAAVHVLTPDGPRELRLALVPVKKERRNEEPAR